MDEAKLAKEIVRTLGDAAPGRSDQAWFYFCAFMIFAGLIIVLTALLLRGAKQVQTIVEGAQNRMERITASFQNSVSTMGRECHAQQDRTWAAFQKHQEEMADRLEQVTIALTENSEVIRQNSSALNSKEQRSKAS